MRYDSDDHYVTAQNPDDSGSQRFDDTSPVLGVVFHARRRPERLRELRRRIRDADVRRARVPHRRHRPQLRAAAGDEPRDAKSASSTAIGERHRLNAALFNVDTKNEIVIDAATGGRTTFKNAGATDAAAPRRRGTAAIVTACDATSR